MTPLKMSSRDFNQKTNVAKKAASNRPVIVTERGKPTHVLLSYAEYERLRGRGPSIAELLSSPETADIDFEIPKFDVTLRVPDFS